MSPNQNDSQSQSQNLDSASSPLDVENSSAEPLSRVPVLTVAQTSVKNHKLTICALVCIVFLCLCLAIAAVIMSTNHLPAVRSDGVNIKRAVERWRNVSTGAEHTCALSYNYQVYCWGSNYSGQLGNNSKEDSQIPVKVDVNGVLNGMTIKSISSGDYHTCAIASNSQAYCWGRGLNGQLGNNSREDSNIPVAVDTRGVLVGKQIKTISAGGDQACVIASDDQAYCWGLNNFGQLGNNVKSDRSLIPVAVDTEGVLSGKNIYSIEMGSNYTCAIASDEKAYCWGLNTGGTLGNGNQTSSLVPVAVDTNGVLRSKKIKSIAVSSLTACVVASDDWVYCWGDDIDGQLGRNVDYILQEFVPVPVDNSDALTNMTIESVSVSSKNTCVIASDKQVYCWGGNSFGQLGAGFSNDESLLVPAKFNDGGIFKGKTISLISVGSRHTCVIASDEAIYCWGSNSSGQLGNDSYTDSETPVMVKSEVH